jgi:hypothetical protein
MTAATQNVTRMNVITLASSSFVAGLFLMAMVGHLATGNALAWLDACAAGVNALAAVLTARKIFQAIAA